jgi:tripartite ATP-independent transporter DctM subunit
VAGTGSVVAIVFIAWFLFADSLLALATAVPLAGAALVFFAAMALGVPLAFDFGIAALTLLALNSLTLASVPQLMVSSMNSLVLLAVPLFVFTGAILTKGGISGALMKVLTDITSKLRGGSAIAGVLAMYLFSGLSGSKLADLAAVTPLIGPAMKERGHSEAETVGVLSAATVMGEVVPPSIAILVLTSVTSVSTGALFLAGLLPAAAVGMCIIAMILIRSHLRGMVRGAPHRFSEIGRDLVRAVIPAGMPIIIFGGIIGGYATPIEASALAVVYGLLIALTLYSTTPRQVLRAAIDSARLSGMLLFILATVGVLLYVLSVDGVAEQLRQTAILFQGNRSAFMLSSIVVLVVAGLILEGLPAIIILAPLLLPIATGLGIDPLQFSIVLVLSMGLGSFIPPIGIGYFVTVALVGAKPEKCMKETLFYLTAALIGIFIVAAAPQISTVLPQLAHLPGT